MAAAKGKLALPRTRFYAPNDWASALSGAGGVVNLAGEPIASRWSPALKAEIRRSRLATTAALVDALAAAPEAERPPVLVSASAVGFYSSSETQTFTEASAPGSDFLAQLCVDWEAAANRATETGVRVAIIRTGIVLAREGGALGKMLPVFSAFAGGPLGTGRQWCSWIHRDDLVSLYIEALSNPSYVGPYNGTAPAPARMADLCAALGGVLGRPSWLPVPDFALQVRERRMEREGGWWEKGGWLPATPAASPIKTLSQGGRVDTAGCGRGAWGRVKRPVCLAADPPPRSPPPQPLRPCWATARPPCSTASACCPPARPRRGSPTATARWRGR